MKVGCWFCCCIGGTHDQAGRSCVGGSEGFAESASSTGIQPRLSTMTLISVGLTDIRKRRESEQNEGRRVITKGMKRKGERSHSAGIGFINIRGSKHLLNRKGELN